MPDINRDISIEQVDYNIDIEQANYTIEINPSSTFEIQLNKQGPQGLKGDKGDAGISVIGVEEISKVGLVSTYRMYFSDGTHFDYEVTDGSIDDLTREVIINIIGYEPASYTSVEGLTTRVSTLEERVEDLTASRANVSLNNLDEVGESRFNSKQDVLISATNIKTINGESVLGSGDIEIKGGSGLELCDIGMALYVDETKGLRRYLNGQIVDINTNTQAFLNRLKDITTLHPSLLCTEEEWQSAKTMSAFGQVGKFVFNYNGADIVSVRLPRVVNVQGLFDLQNLGMTVMESLPNIAGEFKTYNRYTGEISASAPFKIKNSSLVNASTVSGNGYVTDYEFDASSISSTYKNNSPVQQEAIQYPYFIQIATGSETENNIINDIELNNPYSLFDSKYSDHELNNLSWLKSEGQWNAKAVYPTAYDKLLKVYNGTETVAGLSVKLSTETYTDYDFVLNTTDETFRLPLLDGSEDLVSDRYVDLELKASGTTYTAPANGWVNILKLSNGVGQYMTLLNKTKDIFVRSNNTSAAVDQSGLLIPVNKNDIYRVDYSYSGTTNKFKFVYAQGNGSLYYYVGETVQNANLIDAGRIGEQLANKQDKLSRYPIAVSDKSLMPSWYVVYNDGWCEQGGRTGPVGNDVHVNFLKTYIDVPVVVGLGTVIGGVIDGALNIYNLSTTGFNTYWVYNNVPKPISWKASGYIN